MQFKATMKFNRDERRIIRKGSATLRLIDGMVGGRFEEMCRCVDLCHSQGDGLSKSHLVMAIQALESLMEVLIRHSKMSTEDWSFFSGHAGDISALVAIVSNPPQFAAQMSELRKSQMVDVQDAIYLLNEAVVKINALQGVVEVLNDVEDE